MNPLLRWMQRVLMDLLGWVIGRAVRGELERGDVGLVL